ncbi:MAG: hypothetical protein U0Q55_16655 [Vicinamibacterales bacterium]
MSDWYTWLLLREYDETLWHWARSMGLSESADFSSRRPMSIDIEGADAVLRSPNLEALFSYINKIVNINHAALRAFALAPRTDLNTLDGKQFWHRGQRFVFQSELRLETRLDPYAFRMFRIVAAGFDVVSGQETGHTQVKQEPARDATFVFLDPVRVDLTPQQAADLCAGLRPGGPYGHLTGGAFLPPVRGWDNSEVSRSYFSREGYRLRSRVRTNAGLEPARGGDAAATHLNRLCDEPVLRDVWLDGGSVGLLGDEGDPTAIELRLWHRDHPIDRTRTELLAAGRLPGPPWTQDVVSAFSGDLCALFPPDEGPGRTGAARARLARAERAYDWRMSTEPSRNANAFSGTFQVINDAIVEPIKDSQMAGFLREHVLAPSRSHAENRFDHSRAERLLMAHAWIRPWPLPATTPDGEPAIDAWHQAFIELLYRELQGKGLTVEERVELWNGEAESDVTAAGLPSFFFEASGMPIHLRYTGDPQEADVTKRRLLLPMGSVLDARTLHLDRGARSRIDARLVMV